MTELVLHWSPLSPFVRKVMCCVHELELESRIRCIRTKVASQEPNLELIADNPLIRIPTLVLEGGRALFDSVVICEYLNSLSSGKSVYPANGDERWQALRWQALGDGLCDTLIAWRHERDRASEQRIPALLRGARLKVDSTLDRLEAEVLELEAAPYGIGHIAIGCALGYLGVRFSDLEWCTNRPMLAGWHTEFESRSSSQLTKPPSQV